MLSVSIRHPRGSGGPGASADALEPCLFNPPKETVTWEELYGPNVPEKSGPAEALDITGQAREHNIRGRVMNMRPDEGQEYGIVGCAVGAAFAVLIAEEMFVSGCRFVISVTSSGQIRSVRAPPYFIVIDRALRDEGTSYHYLPPADFAEADGALVEAAMRHLRETGQAICRGAAWTTDAPFRETAAAIEQARARGILAVEMEAAALYAFAQRRRKSVLCLAHVTNRMAVDGGDFEKGEADGAYASLAVIAAAASTKPSSMRCTSPKRSASRSS